MAAMLARVEDMFDAAESLEELRAMLTEGFNNLPTDGMAKVLAQAFLLANMAGRADAVEDAE